jgi:peptide deformylase
MTIKDLQITGVLVLAALSIHSCCQGESYGHFSEDEKKLIAGADSIMRVLTIDNPSDEAVLRAESSDLSAEALLSDEYGHLAELMVATVTHPSQDGVGIAGPQVGISKRIVAVQRFDKEPVEWNGKVDHPFEVYPNVKIVWASDSLTAGPEGCLSVPERRGDVMRSQEIIIEFVDLEALRHGRIQNQPHHQTVTPTGGNTELPMVRDTVKGFTAVIFQHEIDHLDGILYIDRL